MNRSYFNGDILDADEVILKSSDRAFQYGDGLFETMIWENGLLKFERYHNERLSSGMSALHLKADVKHAFETIPHLVDKNDYRIKLQVWRNTGGRYTPTSSSASVLVTTTPYSNKGNSIKENAAIAETVQVAYSKWSAFKTINALPYVMAGIEKTERNLDEIIILDQEGHLSECGSSNLFWKIKDTYYTPSLECGCIDGIMRKHIIYSLKEADISLVEGKFKPEILSNAIEVFTSNITGIAAIQSLNGIEYSTKLSIRELLSLLP